MQRNRRIVNFGGNVRFTAPLYYSPETQEEVLEILRMHRSGKIRVAGSLHGWSASVVSPDALIDLSHFDTVEFRKDGDGLTVSAGGGAVIGDILSRLKSDTNYMLPTLGEVTVQTIAGAVSTGTHGSGMPSMSDFIERMTVAAYDPDSGEPVMYEWSKGDELLAARCALGCMGIVLEVTIRCVRDFKVEESVAEYGTIDEALAQEKEYPLQEFLLVPYLWKYFSFRRRKITGETESRLSQPLYRLYRFFGLDVATHALIKILVNLIGNPKLIRGFFKKGISPFLFRNTAVTDDAAVMLTRHHELYRHLEMELFIPSAHIRDAADAARQLIDFFAGQRKDTEGKLKTEIDALGLGADLTLLRGSYTQHYPLFFRKVLPDETLISMTGGAEAPFYTMSFFTYSTDMRNFFRMADFIADLFSRLYGALPHWGKYFPLDNGRIEPFYPNLGRFRELCRRVDPDGVFRNRFIERTLGFSRDEPAPESYSV